LGVWNWGKTCRVRPRSNDHDRAVQSVEPLTSIYIPFGEQGHVCSNDLPKSLPVRRNAARFPTRHAAVVVDGLGLGLAFKNIGHVFDGLDIGLAFDGIGFGLASENRGFAFEGFGLAFKGLK